MASHGGWDESGAAQRVDARVVVPSAIGRTPNLGEGQGEGWADARRSNQVAVTDDRKADRSTIGLGAGRVCVEFEGRGQSVDAFVERALPARGRAQPGVTGLCREAVERVGAVRGRERLERVERVAAKERGESREGPRTLL